MLIFEDRLPSNDRTAIIAKIRSVSHNLGIDPNWLMAVINFETNGTFSTTIQNPFSNATGLIQFMPNTAAHLGTSIGQLKQMDFIRQLDVVERYYRPYKSKIKGFIDLYLATFFPLAMGKPDDWVLQTKTLSAKRIADQNPIFNDGGKVTVGSIKRALLKKIPTAYLKYLVVQNQGFVITSLLVVLAMVFRKPLVKWAKSNLKLAA